MQVQDSWKHAQPSMRGCIAVLSGLFNGLFITLVKLESRWKGENIWLVEMVVSCLVMPTPMVFFSSSGWWRTLGQVPRFATMSALLFGLPGSFARSVLARVSIILALRSQKQT